MGKKLTDAQIKMRVKSKNPNLTVAHIGQSNDDMCLCECNICKGVFEWKREFLLNSKKCSCKICHGEICVKGINDIATTAPEYVRFFVDQSLTTKYTKSSHVKIQMKCPDCGHIKEGYISDLTSHGFSCPRCKGTISFPNRMSYALLEQLPIENWETEYSPNWAKGYRYDNYFMYNNQFYILEMDGEFHYKDNDFSGVSVIDQQEIDRKKDALAKLHNIKIIRINCFNTSIKKIKEEFYKSEFNQLFDLDKIDWDKCGQQAVSNLLFDVCQYYMKYKFNKSQKEIAKNFHISVDTIRVYLQQGADCGLCDYTTEAARYNSIYLGAQAKRKNINNEFVVYDPDNKDIGHFFTNIDCVNYLNSIQKEHSFSSKAISAVLNKHRGSLWGYRFVRIKERRK